MLNKMPHEEAIVIQELNRVYSILGARPNNNNSFGQRLNNLRVLQSSLKAQEDEFYNQLGNDIHSINDLQNRMNKYSGLLQLGGSTLAKKISKNIISEENNIDSFNKWLNLLFQSDTFKTYLLNTIKTNSEELFIEILKTSPKVVDDIRLLLSNALKKDASFKTAIGFQNIKDNSRGVNKLLTNLAYNDTMFFIQKSDFDFSPEFLKRLRTAITSYLSNSEITVKFDIDALNKKQWAAWKLNQQERKLGKKEKDQIRENILTSIYNYSPGLTNEEKQALRESIALYPVAALSASSPGQIQGIIGEITAGAFLSLISNGKIKKRKLIHTGSMYSSGTKQQSHIDIILNEFGFQVKNYNEFSLGNNMIQLSKDYTLPNLTQHLVLDASLTEALNTFYAIKGFNVKKEGSSYTADTFINSIDSNMNRFYTYYPDKILSMSDKIDLIDSLGLSNRTHYFNVFWIFSGQRIVPSSFIISKIIEFFEQWSPHSYSIGDFNVETSSRYQGKNYSNLNCSFNDPSWPSMQNVVNSTRVYLNWNFYLDQLAASLANI